MKVLPPAALLFWLGLAGGWWFNPSPGPAETSNDGGYSSSRITRSRGGNSGSPLPADAAAWLAAVHAAPNVTERLRAVIQLARELPVSELPRWYDRDGFGLRDAAELGVFYDITRRRWLEEDPEGLIRHMMLKNSTDFGETAALWAKRDPGRALAMLETQRDPAAFQRLQSALLPGLAESRPDHVLPMVRLSRQQSRHQWNQALLKLAEHHPEKLTAAAAGWPSFLRQSAGEAIAAAGLLRDFPGELARLLESPDGKSLWSGALGQHQIGGQLEDSIFRNLDRLPGDWIEALSGNASQIVRNDPARWLTLDFDALGVNPDQADSLRVPALFQLASRDPETALSHLAGLDFTSEIYRHPFMQAVVALAGKDRAAAERWLDRVPEDNAEVRASLLDGIDRMLNPAAHAPTTENLLVSLRSLESGEAWKFTHQLSAASPEILHELRGEILKLPSHEQAAAGQVLLGTGNLQNLPTVLAGELIVATLQHPQPAGENPPHSSRDESRFIGSISDFAVRWTLDNPSSATRWAARLAPGDTRQWVLRNMAANWIGFDTPAANTWIATLSAGEQSDVRQHLEKSR